MLRLYKTHDPTYWDVPPIPTALYREKGFGFRGHLSMVALNPQPFQPFPVTIETPVIGASIIVRTRSFRVLYKGVSSRVIQPECPKMPNKTQTLGPNPRHFRKPHPSRLQTPKPPHPLSAPGKEARAVRKRRLLRAAGFRGGGCSRGVRLGV